MTWTLRGSDLQFVTGDVDEKGEADLFGQPEYMKVKPLVFPGGENFGLGAGVKDKDVVPVGIASECQVKETIKFLVFSFTGGDFQCRFESRVNAGDFQPDDVSVLVLFRTDLGHGVGQVTERVPELAFQLLFSGPDFIGEVVEIDPDQGGKDTYEGEEQERISDQFLVELDIIGQQTGFLAMEEQKGDSQDKIKHRPG